MNAEHVRWGYWTSNDTTGPGQGFIMKLNGQSGEIRDCARTTGHTMFSDGDRMPILFPNGDPNLAIVVNNNPTRKLLNKTVVSPWVSGSNPPEQDPSWRPGL